MGQDALQLGVDQDAVKPGALGGQGLYLFAAGLGDIGVMGGLPWLDHAGPGALLGIEAAFDGEALGQGGSRPGQRVDGEVAAVGASGLMFLHGSGSDEAFEAFGGCEAVAVKVSVDKIPAGSAAV